MAVRRHVVPSSSRSADSFAPAYGRGKTCVEKPRSHYAPGFFYENRISFCEKPFRLYVRLLRLFRDYPRNCRCLNVPFSLRHYAGHLSGLLTTLFRDLRQNCRGCVKIRLFCRWVTSVRCDDRQSRKTLSFSLCTQTAWPPYRLRQHDRAARPGATTSTRESDQVFARNRLAR